MKAFLFCFKKINYSRTRVKEQCKEIYKLSGTPEYSSFDKNLQQRKLERDETLLAFYILATSYNLDKWE